MTQELAVESQARPAGPSESGQKVYVWPEIHPDRSDCRQDNGKMIFNSDGSGSWSCRTSTSQSVFGDIWHSTFSVKDGNGADLFGLGEYNSPNMSPGREYPWGASFSFRPEFFDRIAGVTQYSRC